MKIIRGFVEDSDNESEDPLLKILNGGDTNG
jgi:hypothetical protein